MAVNIPVDHKLNRFYRRSAGLMGLVLIAFGVLGFAQRLAFFSTEGARVAGLSSNGLLSLISVVVGALLVAGAVIGGNVAAWLNMGFGAAFLVSGLVNLALLRTSLNFLAFDMPNVIFSFVSGLILLTCGMYGRVSGGLPADNPYWRSRHGLPPRLLEGEDVAAEAFTGGPRPPVRASGGDMPAGERPPQPVAARPGGSGRG